MVKNEQLPTWEADQIKLISQLAHEFVLPLSFSAQVNELFSTDPTARYNDELVESARRQFQDYSHLTKSLEYLRSYQQNQIALIPINLSAVVEDVCQEFQPRLQRQGHRLVIHENPRAIALGDKVALGSALTALLKITESTVERSSQIDLEVHARPGDIQVCLTSTKSSLTRPHVKRLIQQSGHLRRPLIESGASALPIILAQELTRSMQGKLDFSRLHGRAAWTISLLKSRQLALWH